MIISYNTALSNFSLTNGYGVAGWGIINSLKKLGHSVYFDAAIAPVEFTFAQPDYFTPNDHQYQILYTPWESTELPLGWLDKFNSADEVWTTSEWVKDVYIQNGVTRPIHVYKHGIEKHWKPRMKKRQGPIKFLQVGGPANRKNSQFALDTFREAFKDDRTKATLTIKAFQRNLTRWPDGARVRDPNELPNVTVDTRMLEVDALVNLFDRHDVNYYPSQSEGFGLIPLQSLAQGTPTICTKVWAPYGNYLNDLGLKAELTDHTFGDEHTGQIYEVDFDDAVSKLRQVQENYEEYSKKFFRQSFAVHEEYDWTTLTERAFDHIVKKFDK